MLHVNGRVINILARRFTCVTLTCLGKVNENGETDFILMQVL